MNQKYSMVPEALPSSVPTDSYFLQTYITPRCGSVIILDGSINNIGALHLYHTLFGKHSC
ncbi:hypothetical protein A8C56_05695 [Niabella ginsenosidivorans]|uniref:Uncharacterized protein n=1 Tax=Niabella ginsenosidivorans TaxID=1176587 RepID=A0A1A9I1F0_9BACT|nr:hypothetical protein A8C56_05695 [Niabella ginsenosidivorans]